MRSKSIPSSTRRLWCLSLLNLILFYGLSFRISRACFGVGRDQCEHLFAWCAGFSYLIISFSLVSIATVLFIGGGIPWLLTLYNSDDHHGLH